MTVSQAEPVRRLEEIEGVTNLWVVHPVSNALTPRLAALGVPANAVSLAGMGCGVLAGVAYFHFRDPWAAVAGFGLMVAWHVLDGVDGQLARLTRTQSPTGKVLDGLCDYVTFGSVYVGLALALSREHGAWVWGVVAPAGACHAVQSALYEAQRQDYLSRGWGRASAAPAGPDAAAGAPGMGAADGAAPGGFGRVAAGLHRLYAGVQVLGAGGAGTRRRLDALLGAQAGGGAAGRLLYRREFAPVVRRWSVLSANTRTVGLLAFALLQAPLGYFAVEIVGLSAVLAVLLARQGARTRRFLARLEAGDGARA